MSRDIKNFKPPKNGKHLTGDFSKYQPKKYFGKHPIWYRSSYELRFMHIMEMNSAVESWSSEQVTLKYYMIEKSKDGRLVKKEHNYSTDFSVKLRNGEKYIIEVKPESQSPKVTNMQKLTSLNESEIFKSFRNPIHYKNFCKWRAALQFAKFNGMKFKVITERHLKTKIF